MIRKLPKTASALFLAAVSLGFTLSGQPSYGAADDVIGRDTDPQSGIESGYVSDGRGFLHNPGRFGVGITWTDTDGKKYFTKLRPKAWYYIPAGTRVAKIVHVEDLAN